MNKKPVVRRQAGQKRFLINAAVLLAACIFLIIRMPTWGVAQIIVVALVAALGAFQLLLYFKLR
ncbi:MAG: hypothetical protein J1E39_00865 [Eubacterium sp.]|nr:hypothetical protein [Eubacterium sp.]